MQQSSRVSLSAVNLLNIGLMLASASVAFVVPFETFLLAYAVLGPLHYLTQIAWMHERQYFALERRDWVPLLLATVVVTVFSLCAVYYPSWQPAAAWSPDLMLWCFVWGLLVVVTRDRVLRATGAVVTAAAVFLLHGQPISTVFTDSRQLNPARC